MTGYSYAGFDAPRERRREIRRETERRAEMLRVTRETEDTIEETRFGARQETRSVCDGRGLVAVQSARSESTEDSICNVFFTRLSQPRKGES